MRRAVAAAVLLSVSIGSAYARDQQSFSGRLAEMMAGKRVLLVSAHPDDESLFAPLLAEVCRFNGAT